MHPQEGASKQANCLLDAAPRDGNASRLPRPGSPMTVHYRVRVANPHEHLLEVQATFQADGPLELWLPVWTPGSYLVREYARHVQDFEAQDTAGRPLPWARVDKNTWRLPRPESGAAQVRYRVYANDLTVRTNHLEGGHAYLNGAATFVTSDRHRAESCELTVEVPEGWNVHCALPRGPAGELRAADYDELVDSPVEAGPHPALEFTAAGKPHQLVVWGEAGAGAAQLTADLKTLCELEAELFGGLPFDRYLFLLLLTDKGRGGLEHAASCTLLAPRTAFRPRRAYEDLLALAAHEYFHLWNVKRIKPRALVPFDYQRENYTTLLWAMEGITSYYDTLLLRRGRFIDAGRYLARLGEAITSLESSPGRRAQTLVEASRLAWIKHYRPDENSPNSAISYYVKGEVVAALLDLEIRRRSGGARSLDDVMRLLWTRFGDGSGVPENGVEAAASEVAGTDLSAFFDRALRSTEELDYGVFGSAGLVLKRRGRRSGSDRGGTPAESDEPDRPWLGVELKSSDRATVSTVYTGSPAARAGLYVDDEVLALDGYRVTSGTLPDRIEERVLGEKVRLTLFRRDQLLELEIQLEPRPLTACWLEKVAQPSPAQRALYEAWLQESFE